VIAWDSAHPDSSKYWWIKPATDAYRGEKFVFPEYLAIEQDIVCGMHIEKGFGSCLRKVVRDEMIMTDDWTWHNFLVDLRSGRVGTVFSEA